MSVKNPSPAQENGLEIKHYRAGFSLFLISQGVVFLVLIAVRYLIAGSKVGPYSQWLGAAVTIVMLWSAIHNLIDVSVVPHVHGMSAARRNRQTAKRPQCHAPGRDPMRGHHHRAIGRNHQPYHDAGLG